MAQSPSHLDIYYFLSHARTASPDRWEQQFHQQLDEQLKRFATDRPPAGLDLTSGCFPTQADAYDPDKRWMPTRARVLVPLYTREYLHDPPVEYSEFLRDRENRVAHHLHPVIWDPLPNGRAMEGGPQARSLGDDIPDYSSVGLAAMCRLRAYAADYREIVGRLAKRIAATAENPGRVPPWAGRDPQTGPATREARFFIAVIAPVVGHLPPGRDYAFYGTTGHRWRPFRSRDYPIAEYAAELARSLLLLPEVTDYTLAMATSDEIRNSPGVLLIDPWALASIETREAVKQALRNPPPWVSIAIVADSEDPGHVPLGKELFAEAAALAVGEVTAITSVRGFEQVIEDLVLRARRSILRRQPLNPPAPTTEPPARPGDPEGGPDGRQP